jgi:hypothetical protein
MIYGIEYENSGWGNEDELAHRAWMARTDAPIAGAKALLYADEQPACLLAAYEHGTTEEEMFARLRVHIAECAHCNPAIVRCERKAA